MLKNKEKEVLLKELHASPTIGVACDCVGINRSTYYRIIEDDLEFKKRAQQARRFAKINSRDNIKTALYERIIRTGDPNAIKFWFDNFDSRYSSTKEALKLFRIKEEIRAGITSKKTQQDEGLFDILKKGLKIK